MKEIYLILLFLIIFMPAFAQEVDTVSNNTGLEEVKNATYPVKVSDSISFVGNGTNVILIDEEFFLITWVPTIAATTSTVILAGITYLFFKETRKARQIIHQPFFAFKIMNLGMIHAGHLVIINTSASANEINLKLSVFFDNFTPVHTQLIVEYFASTLITNEVVQLENVDIEEILSHHAKLICKINCKDSAGYDYKQKIELDFNKIDQSNIPYTYFPKTES